jgi:Cytochrome c554 and c-prime
VVASLGFALALATGLRPTALVATAETFPEGVVHEGVASCGGGGGSGCHGRQVGVGPGARRDGVLHNELRTWGDPYRETGVHSRAWKVLNLPDADAIATRLGLGRAATAEACLSCHSDLVPERARGKQTFHLEDGVGCEACHGGSGASSRGEGWLSSHYASAATHRDNVLAGLRALDNPRVRAEVCLDCHFGSARQVQFVSHRLMSAGHPEIAFELQSFSDRQRHYAERRPAAGSLDPYDQGRQSPTDLQVWAVGQAMAVNRALTLFASPRGQDGAFPEFSFFDCQSCHRTIAGDAATRPANLHRPVFEENPVRAIPRGAPPFNDGSMMMLSVIAGVASPELKVRLDTDAAAFHRSLSLDRTTAIPAARALAATTDRLSAVLAAYQFRLSDDLVLLRKIASPDHSYLYSDHAGGKQVYLAVKLLTENLSANGRLDTAAQAEISGALVLLREGVREGASYRPAAVSAPLQRIAKAIGAST